MANNFFAKIDAWDRQCMLRVGAMRQGFLVRILRIFTYSGNGRCYLFVALGLNILEYFHQRLFPEQPTLLRAMLCSLVAWAIATAIKKKVNRSRPAETIANFSVAVAQPSCRSFPSSHAAAATAFAVGLCCLHHPYALGVGVWALLVAYSRFYLGVHYPSDLVGGGVLGFICGLGAIPMASIY